MSEQMTLRAVGTVFETVTDENPDARVVTRWRVAAHVEVDGKLLERIEVVAIIHQLKTPIGGSERKA